MEAQHIGNLLKEKVVPSKLNLRTDGNIMLQMGKKLNVIAAVYRR